jgi:protoporphyrinogen oxidase
LLINFIGGSTDPAIADLDKEEIVRAVREDLCRTLLKQDVPPKVQAVNLWKRAIPQYTLGHHRRLEQINRGKAGFAGTVFVRELHGWRGFGRLRSPRRGVCCSNWGIFDG